MVTILRSRETSRTAKASRLEVVHEKIDLVPRDEVPGDAHRVLDLAGAVLAEGPDLPAEETAFLVDLVERDLEPPEAGLAEGGYAAEKMLTKPTVMGSRCRREVPAGGCPPSAEARDRGRLEESPPVQPCLHGVLLWVVKWGSYEP
jgi:hypothetical protein